MMTEDNRRIVCPSLGRSFGTPLAVVLVCLASSGLGQDQPSLASPSSLKPRPAKIPIPVKIHRYSQRLVEKYDANGDRKLDQSEWSQMQGTPRTADLDRDGFITATELADRIARYGRRRKIRLMPSISGARGALPSLLNPTIGPDAQAAEATKPALGADGHPVEMPSVAGSKATRRAHPNTKFYVPRTRLPAGIPPWFIPRDADGDGQLTMAEFAPEATQSQLDEFARYDRNGDGLVTAQECAQGPRLTRPDLAAEKEGEPQEGEGPLDAASEGQAETAEEPTAPDAGTQAAQSSAAEPAALNKSRKTRSKKLLKPSSKRSGAKSP